MLRPSAGVKHRAFLALLAATLAGCCLMPGTESVDRRPALTFRFDPADRGLAAARVSIDGQPSGRIGDYAEGRAALRLKPGTHEVRVQQDGAVLFSERLQLGTSAVQELLIRRGASAGCTDGCAAPRN